MAYQLVSAIQDVATEAYFCELVGSLRFMNGSTLSARRSLASSVAG